MKATTALKSLIMITTGLAKSLLHTIQWLPNSARKVSPRLACLKNYPIDGDCIVSPNPSNGIFKILIADKLPRTVSAEIYSLQGVRVAIITLTGIDDEIDLGDFPSGIYLLHINAGHKTYQRKLVKN